MRAQGLFWYLITLFLGLIFSGCNVWRSAALQRNWLSVSKQHIPPAAGKAPSGSVALSYTGCGGFLIEHGDSHVLIDPFFSYVNLAKVVATPMRSDTALIHAFLRDRLHTDLDTNGLVGAILISHAHYDHLADVPALLQNNFRNDRIGVYGSRTAVNILKSFPDIVADTARQLHNLERYFKVHAVQANQVSVPRISPFVYLPGGKMRFAAIPSNHAGHYKIIRPHKLPFISGQVDAPLSKVPPFGLKYKEGMNYNYLIDILDDNGQSVYRIFSNAGAACDAGVGYVPAEILAQKSIDLMLLCGANYNIADDFPLPLLEAMRPAAVMVGHWENFFKPMPKILRKPSLVPNTNIPKLLRAMKHHADTVDYLKEILIEMPTARRVLLEY